MPRSMLRHTRARECANAAALLRNTLMAWGTDIRTIQLLLGHRNLQTTMIYARVLKATRKVTSPLDTL